MNRLSIKMDPRTKQSNDVLRTKSGQSKLEPGRFRNKFDRLLSIFCNFQKDRQFSLTRHYQWILNLVEACSSCNSEDVEALFPINSRLVDRERDKPCLN